MLEVIHRTVFHVSPRYQQMKQLAFYGGFKGFGKGKAWSAGFAGMTSSGATWSSPTDALLRKYSLSYFHEVLRFFSEWLKRTTRFESRLNPPVSPQVYHRWLDPQRIPPGRQGFFKGGKGPRVDPSQKAPWDRMESSMTERPKQMGSDWSDFNL